MLLWMWMWMWMWMFGCCVQEVLMISASKKSRSTTKRIAKVFLGYLRRKQVQEPAFWNYAQSRNHRLPTSFSSDGTGCQYCTSVDHYGIGDPFSVGSFSSTLATALIRSYGEVGLRQLP